MLKKIAPLLFVISLLILSKPSYGHCEIPCGIYGDSVRLALLKEHVVTIEKSMKMIIELTASPNPDYNQLVRWVMNKEEHAKKMQDIVSQYFLHQRIKMADPEDSEHFTKYTQQLAAAHAILVYAMKSKQSTDLDVIKQLSNSVQHFDHLYFGGHSH